MEEKKAVDTLAGQDTSKAWGELGRKVTDRIARLFDVKSLVTLTLTGAMVGILFGGVEVRQEALALFCTSYGAIITYFFTRKE